MVDKPVVCRVIQGGGLLQSDTASEGNGAVVQTKEQGQAQVNFKLGSRAGNGNHKVRARAVGFEGEVVFYASATYGDGIQMGIIEGNNQRGSVRQPLPKPLVLAVTDVGANLIPNAQIEFKVIKGGGTFNNGETTYLTTTNTDSHAPGAQIEMYSYDHDLEEFVTIGLGIVSVDGSTITSNEGTGVIKAGWHCASPPGGSGCCEDPPDCDFCEDLNGSCPGNCELVPDRPAEEQQQGNCQKELCSGSEDDPSDEPECGKCEEDGSGPDSDKNGSACEG